MDLSKPLLKYASEGSEGWDAEFGGDGADFGGPRAREQLERKLLWKLDKRMSILVLIYILNFVRFLLFKLAIS